MMYPLHVHASWHIGSINILWVGIRTGWPASASPALCCYRPAQCGWWCPWRRLRHGSVWWKGVSWCRSRPLWHRCWQRGEAGGASGHRHCTGWPEPPHTGPSTGGSCSPIPLLCSRPTHWPPLLSSMQRKREHAGFHSQNRKNMRMVELSKAQFNINASSTSNLTFILMDFLEPSLKAWKKMSSPYENMQPLLFNPSSDFTSTSPQFAYLDFLALRGSTGLLRTLLPLFGFASFDPVDSKFDAGGRVLGGSVGDGGGRHLFIPTLSGTALSSYKVNK